MSPGRKPNGYACARARDATSAAGGSRVDSSFQCGLNGGYIEDRKVKHRCKVRKCFFLKESKQSTLACFSPSAR